MDLKPGDGILGHPGQRIFELVGIGQIAADQYVAALDLASQGRGDGGVDEQIDRERLENVIFVVERRAVEDAALISGGAGSPAHCHRQERRQVTRLVGPVAKHIVGIALDMDRGHAHIWIVDPGEEGVEEFLLPDLDVLGIMRVGGVADPHRGLHRLQCGDQLGIIGLSLVEQDIDADRLGAHRVEVGQRIGQRGAVERRAFAGALLAVRNERDEQDALFLRDLAGGERGVRSADVV